MTHISKKLLDPKIEEQINKSLIYLIESLREKREVESFLNSALSDTERKMIAKRIVAIFLVGDGIGQTEICDLLKLTPETVQRLKLRMQIDKTDFELIYRKLEKLKIKEDIKRLIRPIAGYAIKAGAGLTPNPFIKKYKQKDSSIY